MGTKELSVTDITLTLVKPEGLKDPDTIREFDIIQPSILDHRFRNIYCPYLFVYETVKETTSSSPASSSSSELLVDRMKKSLSKVLNVYYPLAGRWFSTTSLTDGSPGLLLHCNDAGIPFVEACANEDLLEHTLPTGGGLVNVSSLQPSRIAPLHTKSYEAIGVDLTDWDQRIPDNGLPPLVIQVTRFKCGGVVMTGTYSHGLTDAVGFYHFMKAWSDISLEDHTPIVPDFNRGPINATMLAMIPKELIAMIDASIDNRKTGVTYPKHAFEVKKSVVESMKWEVKTESKGTRYVSTVDCICAHLWQSISRIVESHDHRGMGVSAYGPVEGRSKFFEPPLSKYLFTNVIQPMEYPHIPTDQLVGEPASSIALRLREHRESLKWHDWTSKEIKTKFYSMMFDSTEPLWSATSMLGLPIYDLDFGLGKPVFACPATTQRFKTRELGRGVIYPPMPGNSESSAVVHFEVEPQFGHVLYSDPGFLSLFLLERQFQRRS